jgi:hypothetical protein
MIHIHTPETRKGFGIGSTLGALDEIADKGALEENAVAELRRVT